MRRPLLKTRNGFRGGQRTWYLLISMLLLTTFTTNVQSQANPGISACNCSNAIGVPDSTRFTDEVVIDNDILCTGQTWIITANDGLYQIGSDPLVLIPTGTVIPESPAGSGNYVINGVRYNGLPYNFSVAEIGGAVCQVAPLSWSNLGDASNTETCLYPPDTIMGDRFVCKEQIETYSLGVSSLNIGNVTWSLVGGGTVIAGGGITDNSITVDWGSINGPFTITAVGTMNNGCDFDLTLEGAIEEIISLACNNSINVSMDLGCSVSINADHLLEDMMFDNDSYFITLYDELGGDTIVPNGNIHAEYIGQQLRAEISQHCGGNSCWGYIFVEDKSVPLLECGPDVTIDCDDLDTPAATGFPLPASYTGVPVLLLDGSYLLPGYDNCGDAFLTWDDNVEQTFCVGPFGAEITRTWTVTDEYSGSSSCSTTIYVNRSGLADLSYPDNYDTATGPNNSLEACDPTWQNTALPNGHPHPDFTGYPTGRVCFNVEIYYEDLRIDICGDDAFKVYRRWIATDWCTSEIDTTVQLITIMDTNLLCVAPPEFGLPTSTHQCVGDIPVPHPIVTDLCDDWDYTVSYKLRDESGNPYLLPITDGVVGNSNTGYTITGLEGVQDSVWIVYTVFDRCGNVCQAFTEVGFEDNEQPVPVCDLTSFISVNESGMAFAGPLTFDDGSADNCGVYHMEVERMNNNGCSQPPGNDLVKFCCNDIGTVQMVRLTVWDYAGNSNFCMVEAHIQDNIAPVITCPANVTIDCTANINNLNVYGTATASDVCGATIVETSTSNFSDCGNGTITRTFTATDDYGNSDVCTQVITLQNLTPFGLQHISWPNDYTSHNSCLSSGSAPEDLPNGFNFPSLADLPCDNIAYDYDDVVFQYVDEACFKILRNWTVIDWCQFNPFNPSVGKWHHTQVIKLMNSSAPVMGAIDVNEFGNAGNCTVTVAIDKVATDDCSTEDALVWNYTVDYDNNGTIDQTGTGNWINGVLPYGTHEICWTVADDCGNESTDCDIIQLIDQKPPTPYCLDGIVTVIMNESGSVAIWSSDFDAGGFDNCSSVETAFSNNINDKSRIFDCSDLPNGMVDTIELEVHFFDAEGNSDFCITKLILQDNMDVCPDINLEGDPVPVTMSGAVYSEGDEMVDDVEVRLLDQDLEYLGSQMTETEGSYAFEELPMYGNYIVEPSRNDDHMNGVSTLDLLLIQKHILNIQKLDSPYKLIAADVNNSESVTALDLINLRKLILGIYQELPDNKSWRFVDEAFVFEDVENPFPFEEKVSAMGLDYDMTETDFIAVKVGDVNNTASYNAFSGDNIESRNESFYFNTSNVNFEKGQDLSLGLASEDFASIDGFQFTLNYDASKLNFIDVRSESLQFNDANVALIDEVNGLVTISWNSNQSISTDDEILRLFFSAKAKGSISNSLNITSEITKSEIYQTVNGTINTEKIALRFDGETNAEEFKLMQNTPNPFDNTTVIGFVLPENSVATLKVYDTTGRIVEMIQSEYSKGYNQIELGRNQLTQTGILYYQLETKTHTASKKMIVIK